jgi:hypothetical protein
VQLSVGNEDETEHSRRLAVVSPTFELKKPAGGNIGDHAASSTGLTGVVAGPQYAEFTIKAASGLGSSNAARAKLVVSTTTQANCATATAVAAAPLDGNSAPAVFTSSIGTFRDVKFAISGTFKICYKEDAASAYELLPITIGVTGGSSSTKSHFCFASTSFPCSVRLEGLGLAASDKIGLVASDGTCGTSSLQSSVFAQTLSTLSTGHAYTTELQVHTFGLKNAATAATYILCLCPSFDADSVGGGCNSGSGADFAQTVGKLLVTTAEASRLDGVVRRATNIYPVLQFDLAVQCGSGVGGCSTGTDNRYKIVEDLAINDANSWESSAGCGSALQSTKQLTPANCQTAVMCLHSPDIASALAPTWSGIMMDRSLHNYRTVDAKYDVCYCDASCLNPKNWFKVGEVEVKAVTILGPSVVKVQSNIQLQGTEGSWTTQGDADLREMKLLMDTHATVGANDCYEQYQSTELVGGHVCTSRTNCAVPTSGANGQTYADVSVKTPGWVAICYCDRECGNRLFWTVVCDF